MPPFEILVAEELEHLRLSNVRRAPPLLHGFGLPLAELHLLSQEPFPLRRIRLKLFEQYLAQSRSAMFRYVEKDGWPWRAVWTSPLNTFHPFFSSPVSFSYCNTSSLVRTGGTLFFCDSRFISENACQLLMTSFRVRSWIGLSSN